MATVLAAVLAFALDRLTKIWVTHSLHFGQAVFPNSPVRIYLISNSGAAFSLLPNQTGLFVVVALAVVVAAVWWRRQLAIQVWWVQVAVGMLLGGALSNALDRVVQGYVVDFIQIPDWPVFNVADMGITIGVALLVLRALIPARRRG